MTATDTTVTPDAPDTPARHLLGWDCIEFWVGNARTTAGFLMSHFGFRCTGYAGPETGRRDKASYVLEQGDIRFVVSGALQADSPIAEHVRRHGDGVHDLAWLVDDAGATYAAALARGARSVREPWVEHDDDHHEWGDLELAQVAAYGETVHTFVNRLRYRGTTLEPGYTDERLPNPRSAADVGLIAIDHVVGNVERGELDTWVDFYSDVMGFAQLLHFDDEQIRTEYSALMSTVVWDGSKIVMPINEPAEGLKKSQIQEYIEHYDGPGVQHIALRTDNIVNAVQAMRDRGVRFMTVPDTYYEEAKQRLAEFDLPWDELKRLNILADKDHDGYLLQIFTETITDRPAVFIEIIERHGAKGFGEGNFKALFEAIERDQAARKSLKPPAPKANIAALPRYQPGRSSEAAMAEHGLASAIKLASNESPFGALPGVAEAVADALRDVNRYPDHTVEALRERFATHVGVGRDRVACGPGSVGLLEQLALAYVDRDDEVVYPWPSFVAYPQFTRLAGGVESTVPLVRQAFDAEAVVEAISERTRVVLIANPNNPTSTALRTADLQRIVDAAPNDCLVVVDEAYREFVTGADVPDALELLGDRPNVAVLRTLSKAYGLAGLRVGFLVGDPAVVDAVNACAIPFGVNAAAQAAALAALDQQPEVVRRCAAVTAERSRVAQALRRRGLGVPASEANFWWLPVGDASASLGLALERRGVVTRPLGFGVRVTIGSGEENDLFLDALDDAVTTDPALIAAWGAATGSHAVAAADWLDRLDTVVARFRAHLATDHPGRTDPVPGEDETWDDHQVWAHVAEFGDYWLTELTALLDSHADDPPPFGRTRRDSERIAAIESGRHLSPAEHLGTIERSADRLAALLAGMTDEDWDRCGRHETLGVMDLDAQLRHFHVGHYEEHADQLDLIGVFAADTHRGKHSDDEVQRA